MLKKIETFKKGEEISKRFTKEIFGIFLFLTRVIFDVVILIGSISAMILVYKMFPEIVTPYFITILDFTKYLFPIFKILWILLGISGGFYIAFFMLSFLEEYSNKLKKRRKIQREKFLKDLTKELKKGSLSAKETGK